MGIDDLFSMMDNQSDKLRSEKQAEQHLIKGKEEARRAFKSYFDNSTVPVMKRAAATLLPRFSVTYPSDAHYNPALKRFGDRITFWPKQELKIRYVEIDVRMETYAQNHCINVVSYYLTKDSDFRDNLTFEFSEHYRSKFQKFQLINWNNLMTQAITKQLTSLG